MRRQESRTVSAKLPAALVEQLDRMARYRCISRSYLLRELAEAAIDGRVTLRPPPRGGMTVAELGASDVGAAARRRAQLAAEAACRGDAAAQGVGGAEPDVMAVARRAARLVAQGR